MHSSQQVYAVLQQFPLGFACKAEGTILRVRETRAASSGRQLLEVGFLGWVAAGIHSCGGVPIGEERGQQLRGDGVRPWLAAPAPQCLLQAQVTTVLSFQLSRAGMVA